MKIYYPYDVKNVHGQPVSVHQYNRLKLDLERCRFHCFEIITYDLLKTSSFGNQAIS